MVFDGASWGMLLLADKFQKIVDTLKALVKQKLIK